MFFGILHEYRLKARNSLQFKAYKTIHVALCFMYCKSKEMASKVVNYLSLVEVCETQIWRRFVEETYAEEIQVHESLSIDAEEIHGEEIQRALEATRYSVDRHA